MCGLVGVAGNIGYAEKRVFANLLWMDQMRGKHSTGVAAVDKKNEVELFKEVGPPINLFGHKDWFDDDFEIRRHGLKALIGHNRYATIGAKTAENAHPFTHGKITGAHNGTLKYLHELPNSRKFEVDSEAIFYNFDKLGVEDTMKHVNGAWALTWFNTESESLHFMRGGSNGEDRPLHYVYSKDESCIFWASDPDMLELALEYSPVKFSEIHEFKKFHLYTLDLKGGENGLKNKDFEYEDEQMLGFTPPVIKYEHNSHTNAGYGNNFRALTNAGNNNRGFLRQGNQGTPPDNEEMKAMKAYVGKDIEFFIKGERIDCNKVPYVLAESVATGEYWEIRLYAKDYKRREELLKDNGSSSYSAKVRKINSRWDPVLCKKDVYMLIDLRTISDPITWEANVLDDGPVMDPNADFLVIGGPTGTDSIPFKWTPEMEYTGYGGQKMDYEEFVHATRHGCDWCCEDAENLHDPSKLLFISKNSFLCPVCNADGSAGLLYAHP